MKTHRNTKYMKYVHNSAIKSNISDAHVHVCVYIYIYIYIYIYTCMQMNNGTPRQDNNLENL
jgi:hypothetical protein